MRKAATCHEAGQLGLAESHYRRVVKFDPDIAEAWHQLGRIARAKGNAKLAIRHFRQALDVEPNRPAIMHDLVLAYRDSGQVAHAMSLCRQIITLRPGYVPTVLALAGLFDAGGDNAQAETAYRHALAREPVNVDALVGLGDLLRRQHRLQDALPMLLQACRAVPCPAHAPGNLALVMLDLKRYPEARQHAERAIERDDSNAKWWRTAGIAARLQHDLRVGVPMLRKASELAPEDLDGRAELALALQEQGEHDEALGLFAEIARRRPAFERMRWLAELALPAIYDDDAAIDAARERFSHGLERLAQGLDLDDSNRRQTAYGAALTVTPFHLHYQPRDNTALQCAFGDLVQKVMDRVAPRLVSGVTWRAHAHGARIRVGFVSSHLADHSVTRFFGRLVTDLDAQRFEVFAWNTGPYGDQVSERIAGAIAHFESAHADPLQVAARIRDAQLDVLVHLDIGMDPAQQVLAALRLAPVQCASYGHPATSGMPAIDYFLSGAMLETDVAASHYREALVRLPGLGTQPQRPPAAGNSAWLDALRDGRPLLLCLQNLIKLVPAFDHLVARVIAGSGARVVLFDRATGLGERYRQRLDPILRAHGLSPQSDIALARDQSHADFVAGIAKADLVLDTPWFSGGATSLDALSVGTPMVTLEGSMLRGRQTAAMLRLAGVPELIAQNEDDYVRLVQTLCRDDAARSALRLRLVEGASRVFEDSTPIAAFGDFIEVACRRSAADIAPTAWP